MLTPQRKSLSYFFNPCHIDFFYYISFIFKLATHVTFNMVAQSATSWIFHDNVKLHLSEQQEYGMGTTTMGVKLDDATRERISLPRHVSIARHTG